MTNYSREKLSRQLQKLSFIITETVLYLDTHPEDKAAIATLNATTAEKEKAIAEYENNFGSLFATTITNDDHYNWATEPWPWEMEG